MRSVLRQLARVGVDSSLRDEVDDAVVRGGDILELVVGSRIVAGQGTSVAEDVVATLGLEGELQLALLVNAVGGIGRAQIAVLSPRDRAGADEVEVSLRLAVAPELGQGLSTVEVNFAKTRATCVCCNISSLTST